jgi:hypothetical protein
MADRKISDLTALTTPASGDFLPIVDISEAAAATKNKRITIEELMRGMPDGTAAAPSIAFESDPNTGIYSPGADQVAISTNGTGRVFVGASGRLGLGTSSPAELLNVNGNIALDTAVLNTPKFLQFRANSNGSGTPSYGGITWYNFQWDATKRAEISSGPDGSVAAGYLAFSTGSVGITEHMRISAAGSVGIGTTSPGELLELSATTDPKIQFTDVGNVISKIGISTSTALTFEHNGSERARIDSSGRLLVGTSSDSGGALLQVNGNRIRIATANTPASAGATGTTGEIAWDANYIYVCTATNTWKRTAIATW